MTLVTPGEADRIERAIAAAETKTSGEIVAVIASDCASYYFAPVLWAAVIALLLPWPFIAWTWWTVQTIYALQIVTFAVLAAILVQKPIRYALVPQTMKRARAHRRAMEQFLAQNLHTTEGRTGVMIFVSVAERYAEVIADAGIHAKVPEGAWKGVVDALTTRISQGRPGDGFVEAIETVGRHLAEHFPPGVGEPAGLPNHLIVLEGG